MRSGVDVDDRAIFGRRVCSQFCARFENGGASGNSGP